VSDLLFDPEQLSLRMRAFRDPLVFAREDDAMATLEAAMEDDMAKALAVAPHSAAEGVAVIVLPDEPWSQRVSGTLAHALARKAPERAHAVLTPIEGCYTVSIRAPLASPRGAADVAARFQGGGRAGAAGIDRLPPDAVEALEAAMREVYGPR
jgi:hypothetical protein